METNIKSLFICLIGLLIAIIFTSVTYAESNTPNDATITNVIIFGDSLSDAGNPNALTPEVPDVGNNYWVHLKGKIGAPITSMDNETLKHPLWVNYFIDQYFPGKALHPSSNIKLLDLDPNKDNIDYAYASAETGFHYINDGIYPPPPYYPYNDSNCIPHGPGLIAPNNACSPSVLSQIKFYLADVKNKPNPHTLFIIWAGGNDIFNDVGKFILSAMAAKDTLADCIKHLLNHVSIPQTPKVSDSYANPILNLLRAKDMLINAGVSPKQIYVIDLPDLSASPAANEFAKGNAAILGIFKLITNAYNTNLRIVLSYNVFSKSNLPVSHIFPVSKLFDKIINDPNKYGLTNVKDSCVDKGELPYCKGYLFFDGKHPTTICGKILGKDFSDYIKLN